MNEAFLTKAYPSDTNYLNAVRSTNRDISVAVQSSGYEADRPSAPTYAASVAFMASLQSVSSLVVKAHAEKSISGIPNTGNIVVTDTVFRVLEVFRSVNPVHAGDHIVVTRPGGTVDVNGHKLSIYLPHFPNFVEGNDYFLFLGYIADSDSYVVSDSGSYRISPAGVRRLNDTLKHDPAEGASSDDDTFTKAMREAALRAGKHD